MFKLSYGTVKIHKTDGNRTKSYNVHSLANIRFHSDVLSKYKDRERWKDMHVMRHIQSTFSSRVIRQDAVKLSLQ